ncbi:MAG: hypothetical protein K0S74_1031 [Chlamydiales bacterium]|jgi:RNA ligase (TIGR02306 family)|nr:hypothetical protein [Chlamydiales bacterium]
MEWKVFRAKIKLLPHFNADSLEIGKLGQYQVVVQKGIYKDGDTVIFIPEKSILSGALREQFANYLRGSNQDRVATVTLRKEISQGCILPDTGFEDVELGVDISERLGITKYEPPIPSDLMGAVAPIINAPHFHDHDVMQLGAYQDQFQIGERVIVSEKLHGSQISCYISPSVENPIITSKGLAKRGLQLLEGSENIYWKTVHNTKLFELVKQIWPNKHVHVFAEVIPCQKGYNYGQIEATLRIFRTIVEGESIPYDQIPLQLKALWVPIVFDGPFQLNEVRILAEGKELVSGQSLHIREGIVIRPYIDRRADDGSWLMCKIINSKYKESGDELS